MSIERTTNNVHTDEQGERFETGHETQKGSVLMSVMERVTNFRDATAKAYFENGFNETVRNISRKEGSSGALEPLVASVLGRSPNENFDIGKASVRFGLGIAVALRKTLNKYGESGKPIKDQRLQIIMDACRGLLNSSQANEIFDELKEI